jgi:predicted nucleic acid-binding protein
MCEYAARHELSSIYSELSNLENQNHLRVCRVQEKAKKLDIRILIKEGTDKGEAEAVVWSLAQDNDCRPCFVSVDRGARRIARAKGIVAGDVFDLIVDLLDEHVLDVAEVQLKLLVWEDRKQQLGRPADFTNFKETFKKRQYNRWSG